MKRTAVYGRYSSGNQKETSIDDQIGSCARYAQLNDMFIDPGHVYNDSAISGSVRDRDGLTKLMEAARAKSFDVVLVDDLSRLSRDNTQMLLCIAELNFLGIPLISVADNVDSSSEDSKLTIQMKGIINEVYIDDLRKKTIRGQLGQKERGFFIGEATYGYKSEPFGEMRLDKHGRPRPEGYTMLVVEEEAAVVRQIFQMFDNGWSNTSIVKQLNTSQVPTSKHMNWNTSTVFRILRNEKYRGYWTWGWMENKRHPLTGKIRPKRREKPLYERHHEHLRIISQKQWEDVQERLKVVEANWTNSGRRGGFGKGQGSYVKTSPKELLAGTMVCSVCGGAIGKVSGKGGRNAGYYGCLKATKGACSNKLAVPKKVVEPLILTEVTNLVGTPEALQYILKNVEKHVSEMFSTVPEEVRLKKSEVAKLEKALQRLVQTIMDGHGSKTVNDAIIASEQRKGILESELQILEATTRSVFKTPPLEWIADQVAHVKEVLEEMTEQSALLLRRLLGEVTLQPVTPEVGKPYLLAVSNFQPLALVHEKRPRKGPSSFIAEPEPTSDVGSNSFAWWRWRESNPRPKNLQKKRLRA